jgi:DNA-binding PadR family transcriptional regulator
MSSDLLRGHTDTILLSVLAKGDNYGYAICKAIGATTQDLFELKEVTLYSSLKRLQQFGYVSSYWGDESSGGRRKYYKVTELGLKVRETNIADWQFTNQILLNLFSI